MRNFELFINTMGDLIPVSQAHSASDGFIFPTFDEELEEKEHSQYSLSFSIVAEQLVFEDGVLVVKTNPLAQLFSLGAKMRLIIDEGNMIDLIITNISPETSSKGSVYSITAQDEISFLWSKHNLGYSFFTKNEEGIIAPKDIFTIVKEVLQENYIFDWTVSSFSADAELLNKKMTLEIEDSNPYNVIIEACNTVGAELVVNYFTKRLDFIRKNMTNFSGYRYTPTRNMSSYNANHSAEEMVTFLHVRGGEDERGQLVSVIPPMPIEVRKWFYNKPVAYGKEALNWDKILGENFSWSQVENDVKQGFIEYTEQKYVNVTRRKNILAGGTTTQNLISSFTIEEKDGSCFLKTPFDFEFLLKEQEGVLVLDEDKVEFANPAFWRQSWGSHRRLYYVIKLEDSDYKQLIFPKFSITKHSDDYSIFFNETIDDKGQLPVAVQTNNSFIPIRFYLYQEAEETPATILEPVLYSIEYNELLECYFGLIQCDEQGKNIIKFSIDHTSDLPFGVRGVDESINGVNYKKFTLFTIDDKPLTIYQLAEDIEIAQTEFEKYREEVCNEYFQIVAKIPYLGQYLIDFSPFRANMTSAQWEALQELINITLRDYNIKLQYYGTEYYTKVSNLISTRDKIKTYGDLYGAACDTYEKFLQQDKDKTEEEKEAYQEAIKEADNNLQIAINTSNYFNLLRDLGISKDLKIDSDYSYYFKEQKQSALKRIEELNKQIGLIMPSADNTFVSGAETDINYYSSLRDTLSQYCYPFNLEGFEIKNSIYDNIIKYLDLQGLDGQFPDLNGIAGQYEFLLSKINNDVWLPLYNSYGQYIYESLYENTDELNSIALFNQALTYFVDLNRPQSSYSLEVLDIGSLECINTPRLKVNSLIQAYNRDSIKALPFKDLLSQLEKTEALFKIGRKDAESCNKIREQVMARYNKLYPEKYNAIKVTKDQEEDVPLTFSAIMNDLYYDNITVVSIKRVLREPLKDSLTVEQNSRYKSILTKLIKNV